MSTAPVQSNRAGKKAQGEDSLDLAPSTASVDLSDDLGKQLPHRQLDHIIEIPAFIADWLRYGAFQPSSIEPSRHEFPDSLSLNRFFRSLEKEVVLNQNQGLFRFETAEGPKHLSAFEFLNALAAAKTRVAEELSSYPNRHRIISGAGLLFESFHSQADPLIGRRPLLGWCIKLPLSGDMLDPDTSVEVERLPSIFQELMSLRRFGFTEFATGTFFSHLRLAPDLERTFGIPPHRSDTSTIFTGFELLKTIAPVFGFQEPIYHLASPSLLDTWHYLLAQLSPPHEPHTRLHLPFSYSDEAHRSLRKEYLDADSYITQKHRVLGSVWTSVLDGIQAIRNEPGVLFSSETDIEVVDHLGRKLGVVQFGESASSTENRKIKPAEKAHLGPATKLSTKIGAILKGNVSVHPKELLLANMRPTVPGEKCIRLQEADALVRASPLSAEDFVRSTEESPDLNSFEDAICEDDFHNPVLSAFLKCIFPIDTLSPFSHFSDIRVACTDGTVLFRNLEHLLDYSRQYAEYERLEFLALDAASSVSNFTPSKFPQRQSSTENCLWILRDEGIFEGHKVSTSYLEKGIPNLSSGNSSTIFNRFDFRNELPAALEPQCREICLNHPALWPIFFRGKFPLSPEKETYKISTWMQETKSLEKLLGSLSRSGHEWNNIFTQILRSLNIQDPTPKEVFEEVVCEIQTEIDNVCAELGFHTVFDNTTWTDRSWGTTPKEYQDVVFTDSEGYTVGCNFGHLVSIEIQMQELAYAKMVRIGNELGLRNSEIQEFASSLQYSGFSQVLRYSGESAETLYERTDKNVRCTVASLEAPGILRKIQNKTLTFYEAQRVLNEVSAQLLGCTSYSPLLDSWINDVVLGNPELSFQCHGSELTALARGEKPAKVSSSLPRVIQKSSDKSLASYDITQGRALHQDLHPGSLPIFLSTAKRYPPLAALLFPRRDPNPKRTFSLPPIKELQDKLLRTPESHIDSFNKLPRGHHKRLYAIQNYAHGMRSIDDYIEPLIDFSLNSIRWSKDNWSTKPPEMSPFSDGYVDENGNVIAENFGHLLAIQRAFYNLVQDREKEFAKLLKFRMIEEESVVACDDHGFQQLISMRYPEDIAEFIEFTPPILNKQREVHIGYSLDLLGNSQAQEALKNNSLSPNHATQLLNDTCHQMFGVAEYHPFFDPWIKETAFSSIDRVMHLLGDELLKVCLRATKVAGAHRDGPHTPSVRNSSLHLREVKRCDLYHELFRDSQVPIGTLFFALCAVGGAKEQRKEYQNFKSRVLLHAPNQKGGPLRSPSQSFRDFVALSIDKKLETDLTAIGKGRLSELLYQLCFRAYGGDIQQIISELEQTLLRGTAGESQYELAHQILEEIIPPLLRQLKREQEFNPPGTITFSPFGYQNSWVTKVMQPGRPILVGTPGSGKTEMGVLAALAGGEDHVLWCTKSANRSGTAKRIRDLQSGSVLELTAEILKKPPHELLEMLSTYKFIVVGYDLLARAPDGRPEAFKALQNIAGKGCAILDEAHLLDNYKSKRSRALQLLCPKRVVAMTGTPVQYRKENLATLLHITMPELYPEVAALRREFVVDKKYALALYYQHSCIIGIEDIARIFTSFDDIPAATQLRMGLPCIPRLHIKEHNFTFSAEHSRFYVNLALGGPAVTQRHSREAQKLRHLASFRRLYTKPEALGAAPPIALCNAIKEIAIPALAKGEKVLILGTHLHPLQLLAEDPELQIHGCGLMTGMTPQDERNELVRRIEDDETLQCLIGQIQVLGTGHNCRGVKHIIFLEAPNLVSDLIQGMNRHRRLLTVGQERYAQSDVNVWFLKPSIDSDVISLVPSEQHRELLERGTIHELWIDKAIRMAEDYSELLSYPTDIRINDEISVVDVLESLSVQRDELITRRTEFQALTSLQLEEQFLRYRAPEKTEWREEGLQAFLEDGVALLSKPLSDLRVALLPGPEALEVPCYRLLGIKGENIYAFEAHPEPEIRKYCATQVNRFGARFFESRIEQVLPRIEKEIDILSIDTNGYLTPSLFEMIVSWKMPDEAILLKNALCQREHHEASDMIHAAGESRSDLDQLLLRLAGSHLHKELSITSMSELVTFAAIVEGLTKKVAAEIAKHTEVSEEQLAENLTSIACSGPRMVRSHQFTYHSGKGRPFLSTFAVLTRWSDEVLHSHKITELARTIKEVAITSTSDTPVTVTVKNAAECYLVQFKGRNFFREVAISLGEIELVVA